MSSIQTWRVAYQSGHRAGEKAERERIFILIRCLSDGCPPNVDCKRWRDCQECMEDYFTPEAQE
jgi:hypothetical protein